MQPDILTCTGQLLALTPHQRIVRQTHREEGVDLSVEWSLMEVGG